MALFTNAFNALFRSGSKTKEVDLGMQFGELEKLDKKFFDKGFRLRFLYRAWSDESFQAAWEEGSGSQFWLATDDFDKFKKQDKKHFDNGLRIKYLHSHDGFYTAIWHPGSGGQFWIMNVTFNRFKERDEELKDQGFILKQFCDSGGEYSGFWQPGTKSYRWISTNNRNDFDDFKKSNAENGRLAVALGGEQFCAVFHETSGKQRLEFGLGQNEFAARTKELFDEGFHIVDFYMTAGT